MRAEYLLFNLVIGSMPFICHTIRPKYRLPHPKRAIKAIGAAALPFLVWDHLATNFLWTFNPQYILGLYLGKIPLEEILFFITVPFACLFLWVNLKQHISSRTFIPPVYMIIGILLCLFSGAFFFMEGLFYTAADVWFFAGTLLADHILRTGFFTRVRSLPFIGIVLLLTFIFNFYLTARPVVLYNLSVKTDIYVATIPVEDFLYAITLISLTVIFYEALRITYHQASD